MFSTPTKRPREEVEEEDETLGFGRHEIKKSRFDQHENTTSFNPSITLFPPRSVESVKEDAGCSNSMPESFLQWREEKKPSLQTRRPPTLTVDTAADIDMVDSTPLQNGDNLSPWPTSARTKASARSQPSPIPHNLVSESLTISGGRSATPIYGHFTLNMRPEKMNETSHLCPPPTVEETEWWRRRRLPSPISESGDLTEDHLSEALTPASVPVFSPEETRDHLVWPDSPSSMDIEGGVLSNNFLQVPEQSLELPASLHGNHQMNTGPVSLNTEAVVKPAPARSKGKISFSMGYRADCEKCQRKVPGHYSHIVRS